MAVALFSRGCPHDPEIYLKAARNMYLCPGCGCWVLTGYPHMPHGDNCRLKYQSTGKAPGGKS